jgi:hypothetical protein
LAQEVDEVQLSPPPLVVPEVVVPDVVVPEVVVPEVVVPEVVVPPVVFPGIAMSGGPSSSTWHHASTAAFAWVQSEHESQSKRLPPAWYWHSLSDELLQNRKVPFPDGQAVGWPH